MRIGTAVDPHFSSTKPTSRVDDYPQAMLNKLSQIAAISDTLDVFIFTGDFFHLKSVSLPYLIKLINVLKTFKCPVYSIIGNHDILYARLDTIDRCPLSILFETGVLKRLTKLEFENVDIYGFDYCLKDPKPAFDLNPSKVNVLVSHTFISQVRRDETITFEDVKDFNIVIMGHDHDFYDPIEYGKAIIIRSGALSRGSLHYSNSQRPVQWVYIDTEQGKIEYRQLVYSPFEEVFLKESKNRTDVKKTITDFMIDLQANPNQESGSVRKTLDSLPLEPDVKSRTEHYLTEEALI